MDKQNTFYGITEKINQMQQNWEEIRGTINTVVEKSEELGFGCEPDFKANVGNLWYVLYQLQGHYRDFLEFMAEKKFPWPED